MKRNKIKEKKRKEKKKKMNMRLYDDRKRRLWLCFVNIKHSYSNIQLTEKKKMPDCQTKHEKIIDW